MISRRGSKSNGTRKFLLGQTFQKCPEDVSPALAKNCLPLVPNPCDWFILVLLLIGDMWRWNPENDLQMEKGGGTDGTN